MDKNDKKNVDTKIVFSQKNNKAKYQKNFEMIVTEKYLAHNNTLCNIGSGTDKKRAENCNYYVVWKYYITLVRHLHVAINSS